MVELIGGQFNHFFLLFTCICLSFYYDSRNDICLQFYVLHHQFHSLFEIILYINIYVQGGYPP